MSIHKRGNIWYAYLRDKATGRQITRSLKTTSKREALRKYAVLQVEIGKHGAEAVSGKILFSEVAEKYMDWSKVNKRSWDRDEVSLKSLKPVFGEKKLSEISPLLIERYKSKRLEAVSNSTVNRELALLRHIFNKVRSWKLYTGDNPMSFVNMLDENPSRLRYLERDEWERLYSAAADHIKPILLLLVSTGMRYGEAKALTWEDVDLTGRCIFIRDSKSKKPRTLPIPEALAKELSKLKIKGGVSKERRLITQKHIRKGFKGACTRAKIHDFRIHDLRHTFASWQAMAGTPIRTLQELLGHKSITMTIRYAHLSPMHLKAASKAIDDVIPS